MTNIVSINFDVSHFCFALFFTLIFSQLHNPLDAELVLEFIQSDSGVDGTIYASFGQHFDSFVIPPGQTVNSGTVPNVLLVKGAIASLNIIPLQELDVFAAATLRVGQGGYQIPWLKLNQKAVPTTYNLALTPAALKEKAKAIQAASSSSSSSSSLSPSSSLVTESKTTEPETTATGAKEGSETSSTGSPNTDSVAKSTTEPSATAGASATSNATSAAPAASETSSS